MTRTKPTAEKKLPAHIKSRLEVSKKKEREEKEKEKDKKAPPTKPKKKFRFKPGTGMCIIIHCTVHTNTTCAPCTHTHSKAVFITSVS